MNEPCQCDQTIDLEVEVVATPTIGEVLEELQANVQRLGRYRRENAHNYALGYGHLVTESRRASMRLACQLRTSGGLRHLADARETVSNALDLLILTQQMAMEAEDEWVIRTARRWKRDYHTTRLAPCVVALAEYIRQHETLHRTSERCLDSFDCDPVGNRLLHAVKSEMNDQERELLIELLCLCARVTYPHRVRSDAGARTAG